MKASKEQFYRTISGKTTLSSSGFWFKAHNGDEPLCLCMGSMFIPLMKTETREFVRSHISSQNSLDVELDPSMFIADTKVTASNSAHSFPIVPVRLLSVPIILQDLQKLVQSCPQGSFGYSSNHPKSIFEMSLFVICKTTERELVDAFILTKSASSLLPGSTVESTASPFGCISESLWEQKSKLTISNQFGSILLLDETTAPGMEGAALCIQRNVVGIRLFPINMDGTILLSLGVICDDLIDRLIVSASTLMIPSKPSKSPSAHVILLEIQNTWASGVIISSSGYIVTNAHLLRPFIHNGIQSVQLRARFASENTIHDTFEGFRWVSCKIVYIPPENNWDFAIVSADSTLKLSPSTFFDSSIHSQLVPGEDVMAIGFPLFSPRLNCTASVTRGQLTRTVLHKSTITILVSSASVHKGCSGGALVRNSDQTVIGIVTCNLKLSPEKEKPMVFPSINFSIPVEILTPLFGVLRSWRGDEWTGEKLKSLVETIEPKFDSEKRKLWTLVSLQEDQYRKSLVQKLSTLRNQRKNRVPKALRHKL